MIDRQQNLIIFICDSCDEFLETETDDFQEALSVLRSNNWTAKKAGEWQHICDNCREDF